MEYIECIGVIYADDTQDIFDVTRCLPEEQQDMMRKLSALSSDNPMVFCELLQAPSLDRAKSLLSSIHAQQQKYVKRYMEQQFSQ
jgi:hypothetical protein